MYRYNAIQYNTTNSIYRCYCRITQMFHLLQRRLFHTDANSSKRDSISSNCCHMTSCKMPSKQQLPLLCIGAISPIPLQITHFHVDYITTIASFIPDISIAPLHGHIKVSSRPLLLLHHYYRGAPDYIIETVLELTRQSATGNCE